MSDQNNNKGYDDFFASNHSGRKNDTGDSGDSVRSDEWQRSESSTGSEEIYRSQPEPNASGEERTEPTQRATDDAGAQEEKPSYYYSYGPISNERPRSYGTGSDYVSRPAFGKSASEPQNGPVQSPVRTFTATPAAKGGWQVNEKRSGTSFKSIFLSFLAGVLVVGGLMYTADVRNWFTGGETVATAGEKAPGTTVSQSTGSGGGGSSSGAAMATRPDNIAQLFEQASPAVVKIETFAKVQQRRGSSLLDDPFFRQFFGGDYPNSRSQESDGQSQMQQTGIGTGFFFDSTGYILTNQHVIGEADEIRVTVQGYEKPFTAKLLGASYDLDLAVVKIEGQETFPTLPLGSSDDINIGDWVVAIGNPYGFDHTITVGVLSAKERPIDIQDPNGERNYKHLLQTDASINPGNSGGPLLNVRGEVIGINTAVSSQAQGIGFAIPTSTINQVLDNLKNNEEIPKEPVPFIGAELENMTEEYAKQLGIEKAEGSLVRGVYFNSPAYLGDLKQFDVIIGVDGKKFATREALIAEIQSRTVGEKVQFNIIRQGREMTLEIEIGDRNAFGLE